MKNLPDIYTYTDVRRYLGDYRSARKAVDEGFTNTYICHVLGQKNSKGYFNNVVQGRMRIGPTIIDRFRLLLSLGTEEFAYFKHMTAYSQARTVEEREGSLRLLLKSTRLRAHEFSANLEPYYSEWYHPMVRALMDLVDFDGENFDALVGRMIDPIPLPRIKQSVAMLIDLGIIKKNDSGFYKPSDAVISSGSDIEKAILLSFQGKTLAHGCEVLRNDAVSPQKITSMTLSVSKKAFREIEDRITALKHEIRAIAANDQDMAEELCQLSVHLYPYTGTGK